MTWEWGRVGQSTTTWGRLTHQDQQVLDVPPGEAVLRTAEAGVTYEVSPAVEEVMPVWHETAVQATGHHRFVMLLPTQEQPAARNLTQLRARLTQHAANLTPQHPLLVELDWVVHRLLDVVARLHREGHGVGLMEPDSVIWFLGSDGQRHLVLPDVGFQWSGYGVLPDWLSEQNRFLALWDNRRPADVNLQTPNVHADLETIARLFDWVLSGVARPRFPNTTDTKHSAYDVLRAVHRPYIEQTNIFNGAAGYGRITTAVGFKEHLSQPGASLSAYFLRGKEVVAPAAASNHRYWVLALLLLLLLGGGILTALLLNHPDNPEQKPERVALKPPERKDGDGTTPDKPRDDSDVKPADKPRDASSDNTKRDKPRDEQRTPDRQPDRITVKVEEAPKQARPESVWKGHRETIRSVAFSSDGKFVLSASGDLNDARNLQAPDKTVRLWDARRGMELRSSAQFDDGLSSVAFSPGGRFALLCSAGKWVKGVWQDGKDHHVRLWDVQENKEIEARGETTLVDNLDS